MNDSLANCFNSLRTVAAIDHITKMHNSNAFEYTVLKSFCASEKRINLSRFVAHYENRSLYNYHSNSRTAHFPPPTPPPQITDERNCDKYNHCTASTRFLQLKMMMMKTTTKCEFGLAEGYVQLKCCWSCWFLRKLLMDEVRQMVVGRRNSPAIDELLTLHRLRWLGYVLRMPEDRLPRRALFAQPGAEWKRPRVKVQQESNWNPTSAVNTCKIWSPEIHYPTPPVKISSHEETYPLRYVFYIEDKPHCVRAFANGKKVSMIAQHPARIVYTPTLFKEGGEILVDNLIAVLQRIWNENLMPSECSASIVTPDFKKERLCKNNHGINLVSFAFEVLSNIISRKLVDYRERQVGKLKLDKAYITLHHGSYAAYIGSFSQTVAAAVTGTCFNQDHIITAAKGTNQFSRSAGHRDCVEQERQQVRLLHFDFFVPEDRSKVCRHTRHFWNSFILLQSLILIKKGLGLVKTDESFCKFCSENSGLGYFRPKTGW
ncbi:protein kinase [Clonorchis sinensis]|uniref:Protein kinase n=1 Tax=Clonorchis sinensis TaxID=79923 RepID=G7Y4N4_CLOSI|nr:protein kinase [Clonorchis sinensis]